MTIGLGKGIGSLGALRNLGEVDQALGRVFERLSSGQRINRAADDAAGLAISESLKTDEKVFGQAIRNLNDGVSLLSIADSALNELTDVSARMVELAQQAANGSYSDEQRAALDTEAQELSREFTRIVQSTEFNGIGVFNGELSTGLTLQGGYGEAAAIAGSIGNYKGNGDFTASSDGLVFSPVYIANDAETGDLNGDGIIDLVSGGVTGLEVFLGDGSGDFGTADSSIVLSGTSSQANEIQFADLNNDGVLDIIAAGATGRSGNDFFETFIGNGDGSYTSAGSYSESVNAIQDAELADFNGDGNLDIVTVGAANTGVASGASIRFGNGDGTFGAVEFGGESVTFNFMGAEIADFDGDGVLDILAVGADGTAAGSELLVYDGTNFNVTPGVISNTNDFIATTSGDMNNDGIIDFVGLAAGGVSTEIAIFLGNGDGSFTESATLTLGAINTQQIELADTNGDGNLDVLTQASLAAGRVYLGDGGGGITATESEVFSSFRTVADVNQDGIVDVINSNRVQLGQSEGGLNPVLQFSLSRQSDALQALPQLQQKLELLSEQRGIVGALQSRLPTAINVLQASTENSAIARSRITDADVAEETSQLLSYQIRQQAITSVLAQANQSADVVLGLLGVQS